MSKLKRVVLKLTGKIFGTEGEPISFKKYNEVANQILGVTKGSDYQMAIVVGGGNIFRG